MHPKAPQSVGRVSLKGRNPVAKGSVRLVFRHPEHAELLIKVIDPDAKKLRYGKNVAWYKLRRRPAHYMSFFREVSEYIAVWADANEAPDFLQKIVGFVETEHGLGIVVEAALDKNGEYAPSLFDLAARGDLSAIIVEHLNAFWHQLLQSNVAISDLHPGNLAYAHNPLSGSHFILIDGIGCSSFIPFETIIPFFNRRTKVRKFERMLIGLRHTLEASQLPETASLLDRIKI